MKKKVISILFVVICAIITVLYNNYSYSNHEVNNYSKSVLEVSPYDGSSSYVIINNNEPEFLSDDLVTRSYEFYSDLDSLGRAGVAMSSIGIDLMPTEERGNIGSVKPSGWHTIKYDFINGKYLYNRCHLIGYQLTGENANEKNLITCTRQTNTGIMLEYENKVAKYIKETNNHVLYRVTPIYENNNLVASGIQMEAMSVEDNGAGIKFNIYIYNVQDGVDINYETGESEEI
jgi:DNA-entry nuclease